jgi:arylsulfatase A-like enzyme
MWMAGGGVKGGQTIGATDEIGLRAIDARMHVHDLHATVLHLMGVDHEKLTYFHKGRPERATVNEGEAYRKITSA